MSCSIKRKIPSIILLFIALCFCSFLTKTNHNPTAPSSFFNNPDELVEFVDFKVPYCALEKASKLDIESHEKKIKLNWIEILACLAAQKNGDFSHYHEQDINIIAEKLNSGQSIFDLTKDLNMYSYFYKVYSVILKEFIGTYTVPASCNTNQVSTMYGFKAFSPIAKTFPFNHCSDFGASRTYGYSRPHLGHDMMAAIGTPVIAIESGTVEVMGWNQYGGWRIGIRSFDRQRYYYYAHLRKDKPFHIDLHENKVVQAGDVIGYVGKTGYSTTENVNNISQSHLHIGLELIFNESQKEGPNEIWIDLYPITKLLMKNQSEVYANPTTKQYYHMNSQSPSQ